MNEQVTSFWYDTSDTWGVTVAEAEFVKVEDIIVAGKFDEDVEF